MKKIILAIMITFTYTYEDSWYKIGEVDIGAKYCFGYFGDLRKELL